ncbi:hypothetical protein [Brevundimonas sp. NPDC058933]|uniref:hypothetical protein n=1 Tax=Brevundimonas sp. NPDC058933 TaxID=3346673 RepID=UPI003BEEE10E
MAGVVELLAQSLGWQVRKANCIVEGTSDVFYFKHAARLYRERHDVDLLGDDFAVLPAGRGEEGGVDGINDRFRMAKQLADLDLRHDGSRQYRFIGLFDNDDAGRKAFTRGSGLTRRIEGYRDLFLLHPIMPQMNGAGASTVAARAKDLNKGYPQLDWEVEDLVSPEIFRVFEADYGSQIRRTQIVGDRTHRDLSWDGKVKLQHCVRDYAELEHLSEIIALICALRNYLHLRTDHIVVPHPVF